MSNAFAAGRRAIGYCDRCGFQYLLTELRSEVINLEDTDIKACPECWDRDNPQTQLGRHHFGDPQALRNPRPTGGTAGRGTVIHFDDFPGMTNIPGTTVPVASRLSDQLLTTTPPNSGVSFSSGSAYVAVVSLPPEHEDASPSPPNVIGGVTAGGLLSYGTPISITFFVQSAPSTKGTTDFVSIRGDFAATEEGATATMEAFDISGQSLGSITVPDSNLGLTLSLSVAGIHSILLTQDSASPGADGTIGLDNLRFNGIVSSS